MSSDDAETQEMREENDELQDQEQFEKSEEFDDQGFEYGAPLDNDPEHIYSEGHPEEEAEAEAEAVEEDVAPDDKKNILRAKKEL
jgi:hypothetical protein